MSKYKSKISVKQILFRFGAIITLVAAIGGSIWWAQSTKSGKQQIEAKRDDRTQCLPQVSGVITVLVDRTGATTESQLESLRSIFENIKKGIRKDERLAAYAIDGEATATPSTLLEACAPVSEQDASALTENLKRVKKRFDETFGKSLDDFISTLSSQKTQSQSPILEVLQAVSVSAPAINQTSVESRRELIIFSDMLQHSYRSSLYKLSASVNVEQMLGKAEIKDLLIQTNFKGYEVKVYMMERCGYAEQQRVARVFWKQALEQTGVAKVDFLPMPTPQKACVGKITNVMPRPAPSVAPSPLIVSQSKVCERSTTQTYSTMNAREACLEDRKCRSDTTVLGDSLCVARKCERDPVHINTPFCKDRNKQLKADELKISQSTKVPSPVASPENRVTIKDVTQECRAKKDSNSFKGCVVEACVSGNKSLASSCADVDPVAICKEAQVTGAQQCVDQICRQLGLTNFHCANYSGGKK